MIRSALAGAAATVGGVVAVLAVPPTPAGAAVGVCGAVLAVAGVTAPVFRWLHRSEAGDHQPESV